MFQAQESGVDQRYEPDRPSLGVAPAPGQLSDRDRWRVLGVLLAVIFMSLVGVSIVNVALPSIQSGLRAGQSAMQWVLSGYALTSA